MHYGVKGMRWGQHLFGKDYTIGGKTFSKKEVRADNKKAFEYGRSVTITGRAKVIADRKKEKLKNRVDRKPDSTRLKNKYREASTVSARLNREYAADHNRVKQHVKELKRKYGGDNVKDLVYKKFGKRYVVNEPIHSKAEKAFRAALMALAPVQMSAIILPTTKGGLGRSKYFDERNRVRHKNSLFNTYRNQMIQRAAYNQVYHPQNMNNQMHQLQNMNQFNEQMRMFDEQNMINQMHNSMTW
jgi:hypothetical protein